MYVNRTKTPVKVAQESFWGVEEAGPWTMAVPEACPVFLRRTAPGRRPSLPPEMRRKVLARRRVGINRPHALTLVGAPEVASGPTAQPGRQECRARHASIPIVRTEIAILRRQELNYEVIGGWAAHGGDMVIGTVEDVAGEHRRQRSSQALTGSWPERRDPTPLGDGFLWLGEVIRYLIEPGFS